MRLFCVELLLSAERTAQVDVSNDALIAEMRWNIAVGVGEVS